MLIDKYFTGRLQEMRATSDRATFAAREVATIEIMASIVQRELFVASGNVADIGCGDRFLQSEFEKRGMNYSGFDIQDGNFEIDPIPASNKSFDLMVSYSLIEHLSDPSNLLSEMLRCLKPDGHIIIETPNWHYSQHDFYNDYTHVKPYTPCSLISLLNHHGFIVLGDFPNVRCKSNWFYTNQYRYFFASHLPFTGSKKFVPSFLKGRARGMFLVATLEK